MLQDSATTSPAPTAPASETAHAPILEVRNLRTVFYGKGGATPAVRDVSLSLRRAETLGLVGESGCGKSVTSLSILRLVPPRAGRIESGEVRYAGRDLLALDEAEMRRIRGGEIAMIFQEPMTALNPVMTVGRQIEETLRLHDPAMTAARARDRAAEMLSLVHIPEPQRQLGRYPHQFSGGMRQRAMIAMALACNPKVLIADEPTTALDVTIQAQILELMRELQSLLGTAILMITHDLGVIAETASRVAVMYAGRKVEEAGVEALFAAPLHPYTHGLMRAIPSLDDAPAGSGRRRLHAIPGTVPSLGEGLAGCAFAPRCPSATDACRRADPPLEERGPGHWVACWHPGSAA